MITKAGNFRLDNMKIPTGSTCVYVTIPGKIVNMTQTEKPKNRVFSFYLVFKKVGRKRTKIFTRLV